MAECAPSPSAPTVRRHTADSSRPFAWCRRDVEAECHARSGRPATTRVSAPVSGRYTSSPMHAPPAGHEESVGVRCNALRASPGNG